MDAVCIQPRIGLQKLLSFNFPKRAKRANFFNFFNFQEFKTSIAQIETIISLNNNSL